MKKIALIFAGGIGQRVGADIPKQFLKVCGKDIIIHTLEVFQDNQNIDQIYVVCINDWINYLKNEINKFEINKVVNVVSGGINGQDSIFKGLDAIKKKNDNCIVLIHDGVRPLITGDIIDKCIKKTIEFGNAITTLQINETPILSSDGIWVDEMPSRKEAYTAQAPQCFLLNDIYKVHLLERKNGTEYLGIVDSCGLMFKYGYKLNMIEGNRGNIKVTTVSDLFNLISNYNSIDYEFLMNLNKKNM